MKPVRFGVIGTAKIAREKVIPAMQTSPLTPVVAIASREQARARQVAADLKIERAYGSYAELFEDPDVDAIYNPLPNHLHVPLSIEAARAGKHVLCEKPIALSSAEAAALVAARDAAGVQIVEAFMVRHHPQWLRARDLVRNGTIGDLRAIQGTFSYTNLDPHNVRNMVEIGGGGLYDIGCYPIVTSRFLFGSEPQQVIGAIDRDPTFKTDRLASALLDFGVGQASFVCSTQLVPYQRVHVFGTKARIEIQVPFNAPPGAPTWIFIDDGSELGGTSATPETFDAVDQYRLQGDAFARLIRGEAQAEFPLEDAVANMRIIDALFRSAETGRWEAP